MSAAVPMTVSQRLASAKVPVLYQEAVRALAECQTIDDAKYWSDKSDALAAWAKIYRDDKAGLEAKRLKLHAFRRMGQIARELQPGSVGCLKGSKKGAAPGPVSLLKSSGLKGYQAHQASLIGKMPQEKFDSFVNSDRPPAPSGTLPRLRGDVSDSWAILAGTKNAHSLLALRAFIRQHNASDLAKGLHASERGQAKQLLVEIIEWLDELESRI